jgi:hypothetical protein
VSIERFSSKNIDFPNCSSGDRATWALKAPTETIKKATEIEINAFLNIIVAFILALLSPHDEY